MLREQDIDGKFGYLVNDGELQIPVSFGEAEPMVYTPAICPFCEELLDISQFTEGFGLTCNCEGFNNFLKEFKE